MLGIDPKIARTAWAHAAVYAALLLFLGVVWVIRKTLLVFATALMLAYLLFPFVETLDRRFSWKSRTPAVALPFLAIFISISAFVFLIKAPLRNEYETVSFGACEELPTFTLQN
jgi:predicted PurR-regulated permease PerM